MFSALANKVFGDSNSREIKRFQPVIDKIAGFEEAVSALDDAGLKAQTGLFRERLGKGETLDGILPEAFATVREAASASGISTSS